jgi:hypothetical protein
VARRARMQDPIVYGTFTLIVLIVALTIIRVAIGWDCILAKSGQSAIVVAYEQRRSGDRASHSHASATAD